MNDFMLLLFSLSLSGTVIAGLSFAVKAIWKKKLSKSVLYYLWLIALVRLVLPFSFEGALLTQIFESEMKSPASAVSSYEPVSEVDSAQTAFSVPTEQKADPVQIAETVAPEIVSVDTPAAASVDMPVITETNMTHTKPFDLAALTLWVWLVGFAVFCTFTLTSYALFAVKLKKANRPVDEKVLEIGKLLGCKIKIYQNPLAQTPMLIGLLRPIIILPDIKYTDDELRGALTHELIHKRRNDLLYKWFTLFVNAVHWFNPVVWLVRREVSRACELSCDEAVIKNLEVNEKQTYGETLINLAAAHRYPAGVIATTLCEEKRTLKERLSAIMTYKQKGLWNKILSCALIMAIAASGTYLGACGIMRASNTDYPDTVNIYAPDFFKNIYADNTDEIKQQWLGEMSQRYGVSLNIISDYRTDSKNGGSSVSENSGSLASNPIVDAQGNTNFIGLTSIGTMQALKQYIQYDSIVPLEGYLADNPVWNALPDDIKSIFEVDGHIYAIPASASRILSARVIKNEALQKVGATVTDLDSFRDFAVSYAQKTGNTTIGCVSLEEATDILNAFGLYPDVYGYNPFSYDPKEDSIVDFMTKDAAVDALEYLRELYKSNAIYLSFNNGYTSLNNELVASSHLQYYNWYPYFLYNNCTELFNLNPAYPQVARSYASGFAMTKDTPQPKETINFLVDMLFGSEQNYLDCWLGSSDNYTLNKDGTITIKTTQDSKGNTVYPCMPNLTGGLPDVFPYSNANIFYSQNDVVDMETKTEIGQQNVLLKLQYDALKNGAVIEIPLGYQNIYSAAYDVNERVVGMLFDECFKDAILSPDKTVQQIIDEYKDKMLNLGGNQMLDEMNAAIGRQTAYYYG